MPRNRIKKTNRGECNIYQYEEAYKDVKKGIGLRIAAEKHGVNFTSLYRYKQKRENCIKKNGASITMGYSPHTKVFNEVQEEMLIKYLIRYADIYFGISKKEIQKFAFELANVYKLDKPISWEENKLAGVEWLKTFMTRNPELSMRVAEARCLSKANGFNQTNVCAFFDNLQKIMNYHFFEPKDIYNVGEIGITKIQKTDRVVARREIQNIDLTMASERSNVVSMIFMTNALGNIFPPLFVFPRARFLDHFIKDGPFGSVGTSNPSGWMQDEEFLIFLKHFKKHANASPNHKVLLLVDNYSLYFHINCLDYCKENGIVLLSFPPHCSDKLHPLYSSCYDLLKKVINSSCDDWIRNNPDKTMSVFDFPSIMAIVMPLVLTQINIQAGFLKTGVYPLNRHLFTDIDFVSSYINDKLINVEAAEFNIESDQSINSTFVKTEADDIYTNTLFDLSQPSTTNQNVFLSNMIKGEIEVQKKSRNKKNSLTNEVIRKTTDKKESEKLKSKVMKTIENNSFSEESDDEEYFYLVYVENLMP